MRTFTVLFATAIVLLTMGCEGDVGPAGPPGADGNANVVTGTISPTNADWLWNSTFWFGTATGTATGYFTRYVDIPVDAITADVIANGLTMVSFQAHPGSSPWTALPIYFVASNQTYTHVIEYEVREGLIRLHFFFMPNQSGATLPDLSSWNIPTYTFKYSVIAGTAVDSLQAAGIDVSDRGQVLDYLDAAGR